MTSSFVQATKQMLGPDICNHIFFIHALLGCDTTSRLYGVGKGASLKRFRASHTFCEQDKVFDTRSASIHDVVDAGEKALVIIYNGKSTDTLDSSGSARRWLQSHLMFNHRPYHQHQEQQSTTACVYTCKSRNGKDLLSSDRLGMARV